MGTLSAALLLGTLDIIHPFGNFVLFEILGNFERGFEL